MKLQKAIETLTDITHQRVFPFESDYNTAVKLGIEALKRIKACREPEGGDPLPLLYSETKD